MATVKSSAENLTLNADGLGNDILFQSNGSQVGSLTAEGVLTATSFAGSGANLTGLSSVTTLGGLTDVSMDITNFAESLLIQTNSDGSAPTTGTLSSATDNIGIGKNVYAALTSGTLNIAVGKDTLKANTTGSYNTATGGAALDANTSGGYNTGIGYRALSANTTASYNTAVGYNALELNTTGATNVAVGRQALQSNTTGTDGTAVGAYALMANTTGVNNCAFGGEALDANTTGSNNTAFGKGSLGANTNASNNVAVGSMALGINTTGGGNTAIGSNALAANTTAANGVAVGWRALEASTGERNTAMGNDAGRSVTSGTYNTLIGNVAGSYATDLTSGSYNVCIGAFSHTSTSTAANAIAIGYNISGAGAYTTLGDGTADIRTGHGSTSWATVSDERTKKDIVDSTAGLSFVNALRPRTFKYKNKGELPDTFDAYVADSTEVYKNSTTNHGFIAQEVKTAIEADSSIKDGFRLWDDRDDGSQEVAEAALIPILTKAIQELSAKVEALENP